MPDLKSQKLLCGPARCQHFNAQADSFLRWGQWRGLKAHIFLQKHETHTELCTQSSVLWACVTFQVCTTLKLRSQLYLFFKTLGHFPRIPCHKSGRKRSLCYRELLLKQGRRWRARNLEVWLSLLLYPSATSGLWPLDLQSQIQFSFSCLWDLHWGREGSILWIFF